MKTQKQASPATATSATSEVKGNEAPARDRTGGLGNAGMLERMNARSSAEATTETDTAVAADGTQSEPAAVVNALYSAFARRDGAAMGALYHPEARFSDPVFGSLHGAEIGAMWTMLCESAPDLSVKHSGVAADGSAAHWDAAYTFPATGMPVHNSVDARFTFKDGLILSHVDAFDFYKWSGQALGIVGWLFGWSTFFHDKMTAASRAQLQTWQAEQP